MTVAVPAPSTWYTRAGAAGVCVEVGLRPTVVGLGLGVVGAGVEHDVTMAAMHMHSVARATPATCGRNLHLRERITWATSRAAGMSVLG